MILYALPTVQLSLSASCAEHLPDKCTLGLRQASSMATSDQDSRFVLQGDGRGLCGGCQTASQEAVLL